MQPVSAGCCDAGKYADAVKKRQKEPLHERCLQNEERSAQSDGIYGGRLFKSDGGACQEACPDHNAEFDPPTG